MATVTHTTPADGTFSPTGQAAWDAAHAVAIAATDLTDAGAVGITLVQAPDQATAQAIIGVSNGAQGPQGIPGNDGLDGQDGNPGLSGATGADGLAGVPGANGADGATGTMGAPGQDGFDGSDQIIILPQLPDFRASGAASMRGAVPDPGAVAGTAKFLREDATWSAPTATVAFSFDGGSTPSRIFDAGVVNNDSFDGGAP